jgi:hypothetical protein
MTDDLHEVHVTSAGDDGERLAESFFTDTMAAMGGASGLAGIGSLYYTRAQYRLARENHRAGSQALRAELEAQHEAERRTPDDEPDPVDGFGVGDDYYPGFGVDDDYYGGFGV